jgi:hypothetical protein
LIQGWTSDIRFGDVCMEEWDLRQVEVRESLQGGMGGGGARADDDFSTDKISNLRESVSADS